MTKILDGAELAGYLKEKQAQTVRRLRAQKIWPKLAIIRDNRSAVIEKYVALKKQYGADIKVVVEDYVQKDIAAAIQTANRDPATCGIIVQLPLSNTASLSSVREIAPEKDVDGLVNISWDNNTNLDETKSAFESATATAINWLLAGYDIVLQDRKIAIVGYGKLVGMPLTRMWRNSGLEVTVFDRGNDLSRLVEHDVVVSATGVARLIQPAMIKTGAVVVDAGTTSEDGVLVGDVDDAVRERKDLAAITPKIGGVGPMTIATLFEHVLMAAQSSANTHSMMRSLR